MKILLTGGTGNVGRCAVAHLVERGHAVTVIGRREGLHIEGAEYHACDITNYAAVREQVKGMDTIVHLAALPGPGRGTSEVIFHINCTGTFNIYQAAAEEGIMRVVTASSINALGFHYSTQPIDISYFPIDENHPCVVTDPYSFSKQVVEDTAEYFFKREGISGVSLRLPGVYEITDKNKATVVERLTREKQQMEDLLSLPQEEQQQKVQALWDHIFAIRKKRGQEDRTRIQDIPQEQRVVLSGITNFWANIDARDSAQAIEKGLRAAYEGSHPIFVNDSTNRIQVESEVLARLFFPNANRTRTLQSTESLVSIQRARNLLGFEPEHSVLNPSP